MPRVAAIAWLSAKEGKRDELIETLKTIWPQVASEAGTEVYVMNTADSDAVFYYLVFSNQHALDAHMGGPDVQAAMNKIEDLLAFGPEVIPATPVWAKGVAL